MCVYMRVYHQLCVYWCNCIYSLLHNNSNDEPTQSAAECKRVSFVIVRNVAQRSTTTNESAYKVRNFIIIIFHRFRSGIA